MFRHFDISGVLTEVILELLEDAALGGCIALEIIALTEMLYCFLLVA